MTAFQQKNAKKVKNISIEMKKKKKKPDLKRTVVDCGLNLTTGYAQ